MKKYILRVISYLGFALIKFVLKLSLRKKDENHEKLFELTLNQVLTINNFIDSKVTTPCTFVDINSIDIVDFCSFYFKDRKNMLEDKSNENLINSNEEKE